MPHSRLSTTEFSDALDKSFDEIIEYVETYGLKKSDFAPAEKDLYMNHARQKFGFKNGHFTKVIQGQPESFFLERFIIPKENRFDKFLIDSYLLSKYYQDLFKYRFAKEKFYKFFTKKYTTLHYLTISNWRTRKYDDLIKEVENVKKIDTKLNEFYKFRKAKIKEGSKVASLIHNVLAKGKISNQTIFKLLSSEKLIIVYKYAEGFSDVYTSQMAERKRIMDETRKLKSRSKLGKKSLRKLDELAEEYKELDDNWITAPIGRSLEINGFKKLFSKNDGIFFMPLSLIPSKYNGNHELFINEEVVKGAEGYYNSVKDSKYFIDEREDLSFILLNHILQVDQLILINRNRTLEISSPHLASMLMTSYLLTSDDPAAELYINDVVRNVDFLSRIPSNKTGQYLIDNFDSLKSILWNDYKLDIHKPVLISNLTEVNIIDIVAKMRAINPNVQAHQLTNLLNKQVQFYGELKIELDQIKLS